MKNTLAVFKFEFLRYFNSSVAFVYLIAFLLLNGSCAFYLGYFLERGVADLMPMFAYIPWLLLFFIPAITMRLWADEFKTKTFYQTISLPVSVSSLSVGKFLAAWGFCCLGLILTFEFWITLNLIAKPDNYMIIGSYLAVFLLSGALVSISLFASSLNKNQVIAMIVSICLILFFFLCGLDFVLGLYSLFLPQKIIDIIALFGIVNHYFNALIGLIEIKMIFYFISIIVLFNFLTIISIKAKISPQKNYSFVGFFAFICFVGFNLITFKSLGFFDFSQDKRHTLSQSTVEILSNLEENVEGKLYYSEILSENNPQYRELFNNVKTILRQYKKVSGGKFNFKIINPKPLSSEEDLAIASGLKGMPIMDSNQNGFFGLVLTDGVDNKRVIELFSIHNKGYLEALITQKIYLLNHKKQTIGIISGVDMFETVISGVASSNWKIVDEISSFYNIKIITNKDPEISGISALMIVDPKELSDKLVKNILDYKNKGGQFFIALDPSPEAFRLFAPQTKAITPSDFSNLEKEFGFRFISEVFAADLDNSLSVDASIDYSQNPIITQDVAQILLKQTEINQKYNPTFGLREVLLSSASILSPLDANKFDFIPLLITSKNSQLMNVQYLYKNVNPAKILADFKKDDFKKVLAAKIIEKNAKQPFKAIVVADTDFMYDNYLRSTNNLYFVLNALDELVGNHKLLSLRAKSNNLYRLDKIENMRREAQLNYAINETLFLEKIKQTRLKINQIFAKKDFEGRREFVADELAFIAKLRKNLDDTKNDLSMLKQNSYKELNNFINFIKITNIYLIAFIMLLILLVKNIKARSLTIFGKVVFDKKTNFLILCSVILLAFGIFVNYEKTLEKVSRPVFNNLNILAIEKIIIKKEDKSFELNKNNNGWQIKGHEGFVVYNKRITNLLTAISTASFYEEKSSNIKNLSYFGLGDNDKTQIQLVNANGDVNTFFIGKYDIDLGRGSRGAYFMASDNYDVWLIKADLIDINPNWKEFCYSTLWNLRFGRAIDFDANIIKDMINTPLLSASKDLKGLKKQFDVNIKTEFDDIVINFYRLDKKYYINYNFDKTFYEIKKDDFKKLKKMLKTS